MTTDSARLAAEEWLIDQFEEIIFRNETGLETAITLASIAADFAERLARAHGEAVRFPLGVSVQPDDPMIGLKLINARNRAWAVADAPLPWAEAMKEGK
jgi:hypothetical protein